MAGMPKQVVDRAGEILKKLEKEHEMELAESVEGEDDLVTNDLSPKTKSKSDYQLSFFQLNDPVLEQVREQILQTDINTLSPVEALLKLNDIKRLIGG